MVSVLTKLLGDTNEKAIKKILPITESVSDLEPEIQELNDAELRGKTEEFRTRYRSTDVLLLDDIQFLIGKEQTQEGFFHTFNALHMTNRQILITSDRPVTDLTLLEPRVRSRLTGGLVVDIQPPDHVRPTSGTGVWRLIKEGFKLYRHMYRVMRAGT